MIKILLIINPVSGRQKARGMMYKIVDFLCHNHCKTTIFTTLHRGNATEIVKAHAVEYDKIICCGGDGTLNEVFTGLAELDLESRYTPVGYIPTGTYNDFSRSLGLNQGLPKLLDIALNGAIQDLDIGMFSSNAYENRGKHRYFSYVTSFGAFTKVAYETPQWLKNHMGRASYFFYGLSEIADIRPYAVKMVADGMKIEGEFVFGSVSNSTVFGGMSIFPDNMIRFDDGKFEVLLVKPVKKAKDLQTILQGLLMHEYHTDHEDSVIFLTASELSFSFEDDVPWTVDGEYAGDIQNVQIHNIHCNARVLVPQSPASV